MALTCLWACCDSILPSTWQDTARHLPYAGHGDEELDCASGERQHAARHVERCAVEPVGCHVCVTAGFDARVTRADGMEAGQQHPCDFTGAHSRNTAVCTWHACPCAHGVANTSPHSVGHVRLTGRALHHPHPCIAHNVHGKRPSSPKRGRVRTSTPESAQRRRRDRCCHEKDRHAVGNVIAAEGIFESIVLVQLHHRHQCHARAGHPPAEAAGVTAMVTAAIRSGSGL